jgi:hypothetical protein
MMLLTSNLKTSLKAAQVIASSISFWNLFSFLLLFCIQKRQNSVKCSFIYAALDGSGILDIFVLFLFYLFQVFQAKMRRNVVNATQRTTNNELDKYI